jgi:hypothetical protein
MTIPVSAASLGDRDRPVRVFISYAHGDSKHEELVQQFWVFLRTHGGIDARFDFEAPVSVRTGRCG